MSNDFGVGSSVGQWTCWIPPMRTRVVDLRLFRKTHRSRGNAVQVEGGIWEAVKIQEIAPFTLVDIPEGEIAPEPAVKGPTGMGEVSEVLDFLQAVVNEAAKFGIVAASTPAHMQELAAVRYHLEDMRMLAGVRPKP